MKRIMTPDERAGMVVALAEKQCLTRDEMRSLIVSAIEGAEREMKQRCAQSVLGDENREDFPWCGDVRELAKAIRALE